MVVMATDPAAYEGIIRQMWISLGFSYQLKLVASERKTSHYAEKNRRMELVLGSSESSSTDFKSWFWFWNYSKKEKEKKIIDLSDDMHISLQKLHEFLYY